MGAKFKRKAFPDLMKPNGALPQLPGTRAAEPEPELCERLLN